MDQDKHQSKEEAEFTGELAPFFELLARFDHEDKQNEKLVFKTGSSVPSSRESVLGSEI